MTNSFVQPIWNDIWNGLSLRLRVNSAKYIARIASNWPKWQALNPHCLKKKRSKVKYFLKFKLRTTISFELFEKLLSKKASKKSKLVEEKKPSQSTNIPLLRYESPKKTRPPFFNKKRQNSRCNKTIKTKGAKFTLVIWQIRQKIVSSSPTMISVLEKNRSC